MTFLNPLMLLGVLGVSVPIAIHLLSRMRPRPMDFGAMQLLRRALVTRSRQVKLEDLLLLLLRCLALVLLALAIARPTLRSTATPFGQPASRAAVIGLDGSMSMGHTPGLHSRFDRGIEQVRTILDHFEPGAPLSLVLLGNRPQVLYQGRYDPQQIDLILDGLAPRPQPLNLERSLDALATELERMQSGTPEVYLVSDMQAAHFAEPSAAASDRLAQLHEEAMLLIVSVGDPRHENLAVTSLELVSGSLRVGELARFRATVRNPGGEPRRNVVVRLRRGDAAIASTSIDLIEPGTSADASFLLPLNEAGAYALAATLEPDELPADDAAYRVVTVREQARVLVVSGTVGGGHWSEDAGGFIVRALQPLGPMAEGGAGTLRVDHIGWMDLAAQRLEDYQVIVLADVPDVAEAQVRGLRGFVEGGGGLVLLAGPQTEATLFNARLASGEASLAPARLIERREAEDGGDADGVPLGVALPAHPLGRPLAAWPAGLLDEARVRRYWRAEPVDQARVILALAAVGDADASPPPLLIEHVVGLGRVLLLTTAADRGWGQWVIHPAWPILWQQMLGYLTQPMLPETRVGQPLAIPLDAGRRPRQVTVVGPDQQATVLSPQLREGRPWVDLAQTTAPGFYTLGSDERTSPTEGIVRAVNVDTRESDLRTLDGEALASAWPGVSGAFVDPQRDLARAIREARVGMELWWPLVLMALIVLVIEGVLARRFTARMASTESDKPRRQLHVARWLGRRRTIRQAA